MNYWKTKEECLQLTETLQNDYNFYSYFYYNKKEPVIPNGYLTPKTNDIIVREHFYVDIPNNKNEVARLYLNMELIFITVDLVTVAVKRRYLEHTNHYATADDFLHSKGELKVILERVLTLYNSLK